MLMHLIDTNVNFCFLIKNISETHSFSLKRHFIAFLMFYFELN